MASQAEIAKLVSRFADMRALARRTAAENPDDGRAQFGAAMAFRISGDHGAALDCFERACALEPGNTHYLFERGVTREYLGGFEPAIVSYRASLTAEPENYRARHALIQLEKQTKAQNSLAELERMFARGDDVEGWRSLHLGHALAKSHEDLGDHPRSFAWLGKAKARRRGLRPFNAAAEAALSDAAMAASPSGEGCDSAEPIFVVGLPRSGTTLVDRILSSHPEVVSAGEIPNFSQLLKLMSGSPTKPTLDIDTLDRAGGVDVAALGRSYVDSTRPLTGATPHFVDKAPSNYLLAAIILAALPKARIVCMRRRPIESCLSNYKQIFPYDDRYFDYVYDLAWTAQKVAQFERVLSHWKARLPPSRFMELRYEDLVENQETRTRELLAFCGLPWDDRCLAFHENASGVATPSARQVREGIYTSALDRAPRYGGLLDAARSVLDRAGLDPG